MLSHHLASVSLATPAGIPGYRDMHLSEFCLRGRVEFFGEDSFGRYMCRERLRGCRDPLYIVALFTIFPLVVSCVASQKDLESPSFVGLESPSFGKVLLGRS